MLYLNRYWPAILFSRLISVFGLADDAEVSVCVRNFTG